MIEKREYNNLNVFVNNSRGTVGNGAYGSGLIEGKLFSGSITIPKQLDDGIPIASLAESAFNSCKYIKTVIIEARITSIPKLCFGGCFGLEYINIPSSVSFIDSHSFSMYLKDSQSTLIIDFEPSKNLKSVGMCAFEWHNKTTVFLRQSNMPRTDTNIFGKAVNCVIYGPREGIKFGPYTTKYSPLCVTHKMGTCKHRYTLNKLCSFILPLLYYKN